MYEQIQKNTNMVPIYILTNLKMLLLAIIVSFQEH